MIEQTADIISKISMYAVIVPATIGFVLFSGLGKKQKVIFLLVLLSVFTELGAYIVRKHSSLQNIVYYGFTIGEFLLLGMVFSQAIIPFLSKTFFRLITLFFLCFVAIDMIWLSGINQFNNYSTAIEGLLLIFFSIVFFYKTLKELKIRDLEKEPLFWISTGVLLYFSGSLFIFLFTNYVNSSNTALLIIWGIHAIFRILLNLFYSITLWMKPAPSTPH